MSYPLSLTTQKPYLRMVSSIDHLEANIESACTDEELSQVVRKYKEIERSFYELQWQQGPAASVLLHRFGTNIVNDFRYFFNSVSFYACKVYCSFFSSVPLTLPTSPAKTAKLSCTKDYYFKQLQIRLNRLGKSIEKRARTTLRKQQRFSWFSMFKYSFTQLFYIFFSLSYYLPLLNFLRYVAFLMAPAIVFKLGLGLLSFSINNYNAGYILVAAGERYDGAFDYLISICQLVWVFHFSTNSSASLFSRASYSYHAFMGSLKRLLAKYEFDWVKFARVFCTFFLSKIYYKMLPTVQIYGMPLLFSWSTWSLYALSSFTFYFLQTLSEEIEFRSLLFYADYGNYHCLFSLLLSAVLFSYAHLGNFTIGCPADIYYLSYVLGYFIASGLMYGWLSIMDTGLETSWALHLAHNYFIDIIIGSHYPYCGIFSSLNYGWYRYKQQTSSSDTICVRKRDIIPNFLLTLVNTIYYVSEEISDFVPVWFVELFFRPAYTLKPLRLAGLSSLELTYTDTKARHTPSRQTITEDVPSSAYIAY